MRAAFLDFRHTCYRTSTVNICLHTDVIAALHLSSEKVGVGIRRMVLHARTRFGGAEKQRRASGSGSPSDGQRRALSYATSHGLKPPELCCDPFSPCTE